ncbi:MAG: T9SS type A sorting domain-containing protein [Saprospiraceae bacterium]
MTKGLFLIWRSADKTISCGEALVFGQAEASDDCSFAELSFEDEMTLSCEGSYTVTRTWTATDGCGNISQAQQKITVEDTQAPVFETVVVDQYISCGEQPVFATVAAADACSNVSVTFVDVEEVLACETSSPVHGRPWMPAGNSAQLSQSVHIMDNDSPVFNALPTFLEMTQAEFMAWTPPTAIATDCGEVTIEVNSSSESNCDFITYTYNYVATDGCGNSSSHHLEVLITDAVFAMTVEAPAELDCGENYDLLLNTVNGTAPFAYSWQIVSGTNWQVDAMPGQPMATVLAGEGEAVLNVSIMDAVGCVVSQSIILDCEEGVNAVTIAEISSFELKPNPVNDVLRVAFYSKIAGEAKVKVLNTLGSQMALTTNDVTLGSNQFEVETASLPAGTYLLQLQLGDKMMVEKFVKIN